MQTPIWNEETRELVLPIKNSEKSRIDDFKIVGCEIIKEIELPINFPYSFHLCIVPKEFIVEKLNDGSTESYDFSKDGKIRFRVAINEYYSTASVYRRFIVDQDYMDFTGMEGKDVLYCVRDSLNSDEFDDEEGIIFKPDWSVQNQEKECENWLDKNYPNWRNPNEYWELEI